MTRHLLSLIAPSLLIAATTVSTDAGAQSTPYECDDRYGDCGTPQQTGGGGGGGGSVLINNTDLGDTYQYADDYDDDGIEDPYDNCPFDSNADQADDDGDGIGSACDNCPTDNNPEGEDTDGDLLGDACDADLDGDGIDNADDICPETPDPLQSDTDSDGIGDGCDGDMDDDGIPNLEDNCPLVANSDQSDSDPDHWGDACDDDDDSDGISNVFDNCTQTANAEQFDGDGDGTGDACDVDLDSDGIINLKDNCASTFNPDQADDDRDTIGEACDEHFCYVVEGDYEHCLAPSDAFTVYSPTMEGEVGEEVRLRLFANRNNEPIRYTWSLTASPPGSQAFIEHSSGAVVLSTPYEYHYLADQVVTLTPDQPGTYELHISAELAWDDVTGGSGVLAQTQTSLTVTGEPAAGCSTVSGAGSAGGLGALVVLLLGWLPLRRES